MMTTTQSCWKTRPGALEVMIKPLRPFIPKPRLSLISASDNGCNDRDFPFERRGAVLTAMIPEADVERLLNHSGNGPALHLLLGMRALFMPGAPTRRWQWGVKLTQDGAPLTCFGRRGISVPPDADGFVHSAVHAFPATRGHGHDEWEFVLEERTAHPAAPWLQPERIASYAER